MYWTHAPSAVRAQENRIYTIDKHTFELDIQTTTEWNLSQTVDNYDRVFETFEQAIKDRHEPGRSTYMLSSGIDAGVIVCSARKFFNTDMYTVSKIGREDPEVLAGRMSLQSKPLIDRADDSAVIPVNIEAMFKLYNFEYTKGKIMLKHLLVYLQNHFLPRKQKICISGIGGDELYDDYQPDKTAFGRIGKIIGGWPADLRTIYPMA